MASSDCASGAKLRITLTLVDSFNNVTAKNVNVVGGMREIESARAVTVGQQISVAGSALNVSMTGVTATAYFREE